jgi:hypothetical protein
MKESLAWRGQLYYSFTNLRASYREDATDCSSRKGEEIVTDAPKKKSHYLESRPRSKGLSVSLDQWSRQALEELSGGQYAPYLRSLISREYGRCMELQRRAEAEQSQPKEETSTEV